MEIKTKANIDQTIYFIRDGRVISEKVRHINTNSGEDGEFHRIKTTISYSVPHHCLDEKEIYLSREEIAEAVLSGVL